MSTQASRDQLSDRLAAPMAGFTLHPTLPVLTGVFLVVAVLYFATGRLALELISEREGVAVFWPASGIAAGIAAALTRPARTTIALAVAAATLLANALERSSLAAALVFALCNAAECLLFVRIFEKLDFERGRLESLPSFAAFVAAAALAAGAAALPAALAIQLLELSKAPLLAIWFTWFKSDALGILVMAPAILMFPRVVREPPELSKIVEGIAGVTAAVVLAFVAFALIPSRSVWPVITPTALLFPVFLWLAGRTPAVFSALAALGASIVIVMAALSGTGRFGDSALPLPERLIGAEISVMTLCLSVMTLAAMFTRLSNVARALQSSEKRLELSLAAGRMYAFELDRSLGVVRRTGGLLDRLGLPPFGTLGDYRDMLVAEDRDHFEQLLREVSPQNPRVTGILHLLTPDGETPTVEHRAEGEFAADNRLLRVRGTCTDITDRERTRRALEASEAQLRGALVAGRVFAFEYEAATGAVVRSDNAAEILGVSLAEARSSHNLILERIHPDDRHELLKYRQDLSPEQPFTKLTFRFIRPSGGVTWLEMTAMGVYDENGRLVRRRGLCHDVTEEKEAKRQLEELIRELDHRVKNALATVSDIVELSREDHSNLDGFIASFQGRIRALKGTHDRLTETKWAGAAVRALVEDELAPYRAPGNVTISGSDVVLRPKLAQAFALTVHELATNAAKHGALAAYNGRIEVSWQVGKRAAGGEMLSFAWREHAIRPVQPPVRESYGLQAIRGQLSHGHGATVTLRFTPAGLHCDIEVPLEPATVVSRTQAGTARQ